MTISVMITTRNRAVDLRRTCQVLRKLNPAPLEILITADGCTDDTVEVVKTELPNAKLIVNEMGRGSVASRDCMMRSASGDLVLALDDDSYPEQLDCIQRITGLFETRPLLAVAHFPQRTDEYPKTLMKTDFGNPCYTGSFANSGACLRRSIYLKLPGFVPFFFHMYEEPDYALQCIGGGHEVLYTPIITIRHHYSWTGRNEIKVHHRHARNEFWSVIMRCPWPFLFAVAAYRIFSQLRYATSRGVVWIFQEPVWWLEAIKGMGQCFRNRRPISWRFYSKWMELL